MRILVVLMIVGFGAFGAASFMGGADGDEEPRTAADEELMKPAPEAAAPPPGPGPTPAPTRSLESGLERLLKDLVLQPGFRQNGDLIRDRLVDLLEDHIESTPSTRDEIAAMTVVVLRDQLARSAPGDAAPSSLPPAALAAIQSRSRRLAEDLRKMFADPGARHEGTLMRETVRFEVPAGYTRASWRVLGGFDYEEGMTLPETITALDGAKIGIAGYMLALDADRDIREFLLVESQWTCCFGIPPDLHEVLVVRIPEGLPGVDATPAPVAVSGRLEVGEEVEEGFVVSVYRIIADKIQELPE